MKKFAKTIVAASMLGASALASSAAVAEVTGNIGLTSNYLWRGTTQTNGDSAIQGGLDYSHGSGFYAGTWTSNTSFGSPEVDLYAGFGGEASSFSYDVGVIDYLYPQADNLDWIEYYANIGYQGFTLGLAFSNDVFGTDTDGLYISAGYETEIAKELMLGLHVGSYDFDQPATAGFDDYIDYSVSLSKGSWSLMLSDTDLDTTDGDWVMVVSYGIEVNL